AVRLAFPARQLSEREAVTWPEMDEPVDPARRPTADFASGRDIYPGAEPPEPRDWRSRVTVQRRLTGGPAPAPVPDGRRGWGAGAVHHRDARAGVQLACRDHQPAAGVPGTCLRAAPAVGGHLGARCRAGALLRGVLAGGCSAVAPVRGRTGAAGRPAPAGCGA